MADDDTQQPLDTPHEQLVELVGTATDNPFPDGDGGDPGEAPDGAPTGGGGNLLDKIKKAPPWVWIGIVLSAGVLVIGIMTYKRSAGSYQSGYNGTGLSGADGTQGYQLDSSTMQLFSTMAQNQQTQNGLLQQLIAALNPRKSAPPPAPVKHPPPFISPRPIHPPPFIGATSGPPAGNVLSNVGQSIQTAWGPARNHGPSNGSPVRAPSGPTLPGGGHWAV